jgi:hypothetical protein
MSKRDDALAAVNRLVSSGESYVSAAQAKIAAAADDPAFDAVTARANGAADTMEAATAALNNPPG